MTDPRVGQSTTNGQPKKRARFRRRRWLAGAVLALAFLWLLPSMIAVTPLRNVLLDAVVGDANWEASAGQMSLSWYAPLSIRSLSRQTIRRRPGGNRGVRAVGEVRRDKSSRPGDVMAANRKTSQPLMPLRDQSAAVRLLQAGVRPNQRGDGSAAVPILSRP